MAYAGSAGFNHLIADRFSWICAVWLHLALFTLLANQARTDPARPEPQPISVEIFVEPTVPSGPHKRVSPDEQQPTAAEPLPAADEQRAALTHGNAALEAGPESDAENVRQGDEAATVEDDGPVRITATRYYAGDILSDPRSEQARIALATLTGADQSDQLCALEAMEQVRHTQPGFRPTRLAPHAVRNSFQKGNEVHAPAAAVRSDRVWYEIAYRCRLDARGKSVIGFEYVLGGKIDRQLWDELGLAPIH